MLNCSTSVAFIFILCVGTGHFDTIHDIHLPGHQSSAPTTTSAIDRSTVGLTVNNSFIGHIVLISSDASDCLGEISPLAGRLRDTLKTLGSPPGRIGLKIIPYCNHTNPFEPVSLALSSLQMRINGSFSDCSNNKSSQSCSPLIGVVTTTNTETTVKLARSFDFAQRPIYSTNPPNTNVMKEKGVNVWSYQPSLEHQIKAMLSVAVKLGWDWMTVVCSDDLDGHTAAHLVAQLAPKRQICIHDTLIAGATNTSNIELLISGAPPGVMYFGERKVFNLLVDANRDGGFTWISNGVYLDIIMGMFLLKSRNLFDIL